MTLMLDHIVISVDDLAEAMEDYRTLGFTVTPGGRHSAGTTENALIAFQDGTYIELIAGTGEPPTGDGLDFSVLLSDDEGFTGFALLVDDIDGRVAAVSAQDIPVGMIKDGRRVRDDGEALAWKMALIEGTMSPFFIQDVTPRPRRVSADPQMTKHANGVEGVFNLTVLVDDVIQALPIYSVYIGQPPQLVDGDAVFTLVSGALTLAAAHTDEQRAYRQTHGNAPYKLTLFTPIPSEPGPLARRHGARLDFVTRAAWAVD